MALESVKSFESPSQIYRETLLERLDAALMVLRRGTFPEEKGQRRRYETLIIEFALIRTIVFNSTTFPLLKEESCQILHFLVFKCRHHPLFLVIAAVVQILIDRLMADGGLYNYVWCIPDCFVRRYSFACLRFHVYLFIAKEVL